MFPTISFLSCAAITLLVFSQVAPASPVPICPIPHQKDPQLPTTGKGTQLSDPSIGLSLKFVTLGRGVQNYTCASATSTPVAVGAIASLFDITAFAYGGSTSSQFITLPAFAAYLSLARVQELLDTCLPRGSKASVIGSHYFDAAGVPIFDLSIKDSKLTSKKIEAIAAPSIANKGPAGTGAVPWLKLGDLGGSIGLKEVYRVYTAGGNPYSICSAEEFDAGGIIAVEYSAMYWFYG
ncbi:hypothetical protein VE03_10294 [Pseudogymnoascus sp. 23342-1-I1]|nr:hypothetical protein VE03_10294 [Pseudogymnoascus sp. 23342-1-I1]